MTIYRDRPAAAYCGRAGGECHSARPEQARRALLAPRRIAVTPPSAGIVPAQRHEGGLPPHSALGENTEQPVDREGPVGDARGERAERCDAREGGKADSSFRGWTFPVGARNTADATFFLMRPPLSDRHPLRRSPQAHFRDCRFCTDCQTFWRVRNTKTAQLTTNGQDTSNGSQSRQDVARRARAASEGR